VVTGGQVAAAVEHRLLVQITQPHKLAVLAVLALRQA
jgi:hypothetical protein